MSADAAAIAFAPAFRRLLIEVVKHAPRTVGASDVSARARRRFSARSGTFAGHRRYGEGDDMRDVDWNAYARTGELFAKVVEDEDRRTLTLLVDHSASMNAGDPPRRIAALRFAAVQGALALARLDALHLVAGTGRVTTLRGAPALEQMLATLAQAPAQFAPLRMVEKPLFEGWRGRFVWVSDFACPDEIAPALALLRRHGRHCLGILPAIPDDDGARVADGLVALCDPETGAREVLRVDAGLRAELAAELQRLRRAQDAAFAAAGYRLHRVVAPAPDDTSLRAYRGLWTLGSEVGS